MSITKKQNLPSLAVEVQSFVVNNNSKVVSDSEGEVKPSVEPSVVHSSKRKSSYSSNRIMKPLMPAKTEVQEGRELIPLYEINKKPNSAVTLLSKEVNKSGNPVMPPPPKKQRQIENSSKSIRHNTTLAYQPQAILSKIINPPSIMKRAKKINNKSLLKKSFKIANNYLSRFNK